MKTMFYLYFAHFKANFCPSHSYFFTSFKNWMLTSTTNGIYPSESQTILNASRAFFI